MRLLPVIALASCGYSEQKFEAVAVERLCEAAAQCAGTYDAAACVDRLRTTDRASCDYDPEAAKACASAVEDAACADVEPFALRELEIPADCQAAYACPDGDWIDLSAL